MTHDWPRTRPDAPDVNLAPGEVHVWRVDLSCPRPTTSFSAAELARLERTRHPRANREFACARSALRELLGAYLRVHPSRPDISTLEHGKPALDAPHEHLHFNVSHSGDWALVALALEPVGVDVEDQRRDSDLALLARRAFAPDELDLPDLETPAGRRAFFNVWSRKESYIKALGLGLSLDLTRFAVSHDEPPRVLRHAHDHPRLSLSSVHPDADHSGAVCAARVLSVRALSLPAPHDQ